MKRPLLLLTLMAVGASFVGGTMAFYNDTETSTGNTMTAGAIDLKIDHLYASYNGYLCDASCEADTTTNLVSNGSFEAPVVSGDWDIFDVVPGWEIAWETSEPSFDGTPRPADAYLELHRAAGGWAHADGEQHAELDADWTGPSGGVTGEPAQVRISQTITTVPGEQYELRFAFAARPDTGTADNQLEVLVDGGTLVSDVIVQDGSGGLTWVEHSYTFTANDASTVIEFADVSPEGDAEGVFLDDVRVHPTLCTGGFGDPQQNACELWEATDIVGEKFFTFVDVKPGDHGKHVVSFHVEDNPSWTCFVVHDGVDAENTNTEAEQDVGDTSSPEGELSGQIEVFGWDDLDADGMYEPGDGETAIFTETLGDLAGFPFHDSGTANGVHAPGTTEYLGLAWCAGAISVDGGSGAISCDGSAMGNDAQTDSFVASMGGFAEQVRNNQDFFCADVDLETVE